MRLNNHELYEFFVEKQILALYHANTVGTSITYLQIGGLLSRGAVEEKELFQTYQKTDEKDKIVDVWNDVFLDTNDLHTYFDRENRYGPILFEFDLELVKDESFEIWITKDNPIRWDENTPHVDRYFQNIEELRELWDKIKPERKMITIRNNKSPILFNHVRRVIVDDPKLAINEGNTQIHLFNNAKGRILDIVTDKHLLNGKFSVRKCEDCWCSKNYSDRSVSDLKRLFLN